MEINGEPVALHMKLGDNGEAFFVQETENDQVQRKEFTLKTQSSALENSQDQYVCGKSKDNTKCQSV